MIYRNIKIINFRNIKKENINPNRYLNIIFGHNAQGKTNFLEALYYNSYLKSFRTNSINNLLEKNSDTSKISFEIENNDVINDLNLKIYRNKKKEILLNKKNIERKILYKLIKTVIYFPEEISFLGLYPQYRRNLVDKSIFIIDSDYLDIIKKYTRILKQRNIYLKNYNSNIDVWKTNLIELSIKIIEKRINFIDDMNSKIKNFHDSENYSISYINYQSSNVDEIKYKLIESFEKTKESEKKCGYTLVGPHTDDIKFLINNKNIKNYASEGQKKTFLLAYKKSEITLFKEKLFYYPILLMDDLSNELDPVRKGRILDEFLKIPCQKFITTTERSADLDTEYAEFQVDNGRISDFQ